MAAEPRVGTRVFHEPGVKHEATVGHVEAVVLARFAGPERRSGDDKRVAGKKRRAHRLREIVGEPNRRPVTGAVLDAVASFLVRTPGAIGSAVVAAGRRGRWIAGGK